MLIVLYGLFLLVFAAVGCVLAWTRIRRVRIRIVVQTLASIVSQNLPLSAGLRAAARGEVPVLRRVFTRMAYRLDLGDELSTALRAVMLSCPGEVIGAIQGGERGGTLPTVLQNLASEVRSEAQSRSGQRPAALYPLALLCLIPPVVVFVGTRVVPKYREIFLDFECQLPTVTVTLMNVVDQMGEYSPLLIMGGLAVVLVIVQMIMARWFCPRVPNRRQIPYVLWDALVWHLPGTRQVASHRALVRQLPVLLAAVRAGQDLVDGARQAACVAVNRYARLRFTDWAQALSDGAEPRVAARAADFPAPFVRALATGRREDELAVQLEFLLAYYRGLAIRWERILFGVGGPLLVMFWGLIMAFIVTALLLPLFMLVEAMMHSMY